MGHGVGVRHTIRRTLRLRLRARFRVRVRTRARARLGSGSELGPGSRSG